MTGPPDAAPVAVREARPDEEARLRALQSALASPVPELLDAGLADAGPVVLAATVDDEVVGYALSVPGDATADPAVVYVAEVAVAGAARRRGVGSALLDATAARAADAFDQLRLTARADDDRARSFYGATGFRERRTVPAHYADGTDGVVFVRDLADEPDGATPDDA